MKRFLLFFYVFLFLLSAKTYAMNEDFTEEEIRSCYNQVIKGPYRNPEGDEDELQTAIAFKILEAAENTNHHFQKFLEYASNPPLRYNISTYDEKWKDFIRRNNIQEPFEILRENYLRYLQLEEKFVYLRNIFYKAFYRQGIFTIPHTKNDLFEACLQEHQKKRDDIQNCRLSDVASCEDVAIVNGLHELYNFLMQPAIECETQLKASNDFISRLIPH